MGILGAVATVGGALIGANSSKKATKAQTAAADKSAELERYMYEQTRQDMLPWMQAGQQALSQLGQANNTPFNFNYNAMTADPGYQFRQTEANKALERSAAARGGLFSGGTGRSLSRLNQDMASQEYGAAYNRAYTSRNDQMNRLASMAGIGQNTASNLSQAGQNYSGNMSNIYGQAANAQAAGYGAQAQNWGNTVNNGMQAYSLYKMGAY